MAGGADTLVMPVKPVSAADPSTPSTPTPSLDLTQLKATNATLDKILKDIPGVTKLLEKCAKLGGVSSGPKPGDSISKIGWNIWTHSAATNAHYGHGLTDKQISEQDVIVVVQEDPNGPKLPLGGREMKGQIVSVQRLCDLQHQYNGCADGGHWGYMNVQGYGKAGERVVMSWAIISVAPDGSVRGGGYPPPRAANHKDGSGAGTGGGEYAGRKWEVVLGQNTSVPIIDDSH